jgi:F-type H+-transporting ATPase subunit delta
MSSLQAKRYAEALHSLATAQGVAAAIGADLAKVQQDLASPAARALLTSPDLGADERASVLAKLSAGRHPLIANTIGVLQHRRRLEVLFDLPAAYRALEMTARGEVEAVAETAHPLGEAELRSLEALAGRLSGKQVQLTTALRPELLGGVRLRIGNVLYDGSLRQSLEQLQQKLMQATV